MIQSREMDLSILGAMEVSHGRELTKNGNEVRNM